MATGAIDINSDLECYLAMDPEDTVAVGSLDNTVAACVSAGHLYWHCLVTMPVLRQQFDPEPGHPCDL